MSSNRPSPEQPAVIDRIVDGQHAVLIVGDEQVQRVVPASALPDGADEGTWLRVRFDGDRLAAVTVDVKQTELVRDRISEKLAKLRARGRHRN